MRAQLLIGTTFVSGLILLEVACGTDTVYVYEDAGATNGTSSGSTSGKTSSGSSGKSSSGASSGTTDDDDDTTSSSSSGGTSSGSTSSSGGNKDGGTDGGSSGFPTIPSTKLVDGDDSVLLGIVGDDALFRKLPAAATDPSDIFVVPLAGGAPTKLWSLGATDNQAISGVVIAHWSGIANGVGNLEVWSRASGLKTGIATSSVVGLIRGSADGSRIAFGQDATLAGNKPNSTSIGIRGIGDATNIVTLSGATGQVNLAATASCAPQLSFVGQTFFAEFCLGTVATQNLARLVALPAGSTTLKRIDAADDAAANTLAGNVRFSADSSGSKIVAAALGGSTNTGKVFTVANPTTGIIDLEGFPTALGGGLYTMTPDGTHVLYRLAPNASTAGDLKAAVVTAAPATIKTISADVLAITNLSLDGHALMFRKLAPASSLVDVNLVDFTVAAPAPTAILAEQKGLPLGFTGNSAQAIYLDGTPLPAAPPILKSKPVAGGAGKDLVTGALGGRAPGAGTGFVFFTNVQNGTSSFPTVADINYVDAATGSAPKKISSGVPIASNDTELFLSGKKVVYTRLLPAGEEGIYTITLP